jgi:biotin transporter BioY
MSLLPLGILLGLVPAGLTAWQLGGSSGTGVLLGYSLAVAVGGLGAAWQQRLLRRGSPQVMTAFVATFLVKLVVLACGAVLLRTWTPAALRADWVSYLVTFPTAVLWVTVISSIENLRYLRSRAPRRAADSGALAGPVGESRAS